MTTTFPTGVTTPFDLENFDIGLDLEWSPELETELAREVEQTASERLSEGGATSPDGSLGLPLTPATTQFETLPAVLDDGAVVQEMLLPQLAPLDASSLLVSQAGDDLSKFSSSLDGFDWASLISFNTFTEAERWQ